MTQAKTCLVKAKLEDLPDLLIRSQSLTSGVAIPYGTDVSYCLVPNGPLNGRRAAAHELRVDFRPLVTERASWNAITRKHRGYAARMTTV